MSVFLITEPKCSLAASHAAPESRWVCRRNRQSDSRTDPRRYGNITLSARRHQCENHPGKMSAYTPGPLAARLNGSRSVWYSLKFVCLSYGISESANSACDRRCFRRARRAVEGVLNTSRRHWSSFRCCALRDIWRLDETSETTRAYMNRSLDFCIAPGPPVVRIYIAGHMWLLSVSAHARDRVTTGQRHFRSVFKLRSTLLAGINSWCIPSASIESFYFPTQLCSHLSRRLSAWIRHSHRPALTLSLDPGLNST